MKGLFLLMVGLSWTGSAVASRCRPSKPSSSSVVPSSSSSAVVPSSSSSAAPSSSSRITPSSFSSVPSSSSSISSSSPISSSSSSPVPSSSSSSIASSSSSVSSSASSSSSAAAVPSCYPYGDNLVADSNFGLSDSVLQWWTPVGDTQHGITYGQADCYNDYTEPCAQISITEPGTYGLSQALSTVSGQSYFASVAYERIGGTTNADNTVTLALDNSDGTTVVVNADSLPSGDYHTFTTHFVASSDTTTLTLSIGTAGSTGVGFFLSAVMVKTCSQQEPLSN